MSSPGHQIQKSREAEECADKILDSKMDANIHERKKAGDDRINALIDNE